MSSVRAPRIRGRRPPKISCWVWTKNSISRMPPRPSLTSWPGTVDLLVAAHGVNLPLHRMNVGDRRVVEIFAPDERRELGEEALAEREVAGDGPRLDHRRALPVLAERLVIGEGAGESTSATGVDAGSGRRRRSTRNT